MAKPKETAPKAREGDDLIHAGPTKQFFVKMITRDIELEDAILDLLDNCIDGVLRSIREGEKKKDTSKDRPYVGYQATITARPDHFEIVDNCGGIDSETAKNSAFMLGRRDQKDNDLETIGMYGIGMKRALFKMGRSAVVHSHPRTEKPFQVSITPEWLADDAKWTLPLLNARNELENGPGTSIRVEKLYDTISRQFDEKRDPFLGRLRTRIGYFFSLILEKGFKVELNGEAIRPVDLTLLAPNLEAGAKVKGKTKAPGIHPYVFKGLIDDVSVELSVGFYRPLASQSEIDEELTEGGGRQRSKDHAGWTVICNDRIVLHADKSVVTGWGVDGVPQYHGQFIAIAGVVSFRSKASEKLPLTTTKRGIDVSSPLFLQVRERMMEGLKHFTQFTYKWKGREKESDVYFKEAAPARAMDIARSVPDTQMAPVRKHEGKLYSPSLPAPHQDVVDVRISFTKPKSDVMKIAKAVFDDAAVEPNKIGAHCFDQTLRGIKK